jgi:hypothetical protein
VDKEIINLRGVSTNTGINKFSNSAFFAVINLRGVSTNKTIKCCCYCVLLHGAF